MKVLLAVDFTPDSGRGVNDCAGHAWPPGTVVRVLGVVEKIPPSAAELWHDAAGSLEAVWQARTERVEELVRAAAAVLQNKGLQTETVVRLGRRRKAISSEARSWPADLIIDSAKAFGRLPGI